MAVTLKQRLAGLRQFIGIEPKQVAPTQTVGAGGTAIYGGFIEPKEKDPRLSGTQRYRTFSDILANVSIAAAGVRHFLNLVSKAGWVIEPAQMENASEQAKADEIALMVEESLTEMNTPWHRVIRRAAMYRMYGFSTQEWTMRRREEDGVIVYMDVEPRAQRTIERWDTDYHGRVYGCVQRAPQDSQLIYLPIQKLFYMVDDSLDDSPEGLGLFRHIVKPSDELFRYEQLEGYGYETDLRGIPIGRGPFQTLRDMQAAGDITETQRLSIEAPLREFVENHIRNPQLGMLLDSMTYETDDEKRTPSSVKQWDVELMTGSSNSQGDMANAISRKNREIARVLGVEHLLLGEGSRGSAALSVDKNRQFAMLVDGTLQELGETTNRDLVFPMLVVNGWDKKYAPDARPEAIQHREVEEVTGALADMAKAGAMLDPEDPAIGEVRSLLGLSQPLIINTALDAAISDDPGGDDPTAGNGDSPDDPDDTPEGRGTGEEED